jgi:LEA14-like dessication related protein
LRVQDNSTYQINLGFSFDVPVLGVVNVPVSKSGELPLLKLPKVRLDALRVSRLSLTGAELILAVKLNNPNAFSMLIDHLQYQLDINERSWFSGDSRDSVQITEKGESIINIPVSISFLEVGRSAYQLLSGDRDLNYQFGGEIDLGTSIPLLQRVSLPFDQSGEIKVTR